MPGRQQIPSFQIASGTTNERDNSYNIPTGSIFYNTDTSNIELSGNVVVAGDISGVNEITFSDSTLQNTSSVVLEYISGYCDGQKILVKHPANVLLGEANPKIQLESVTAVQRVAYSQQYSDVTGSVVVYCPPEGTTLVIYSFQFMLSYFHGHAISQWIFSIDNQEVTRARRGYAVYNDEGGYGIMKIPIRINDGGVDVGGTGGYLSSWTSPKTLKCRYRQYSSGNMVDIHQTQWWDGTAANGGQFCMPTVTLIAIKQ